MRDRNLYTATPKNNSYREWLRYLVQSSDPEAGELPFLIGLLNDCIRANGLTEAQQKAVQPYIDEGAEFIKESVFNFDDEIEWDQTNIVHFPDKTGGA